MEDVTNKPAGRAKRKKRKKSARQKFYRLKNDERRRQQTSKDDANPSTGDDRNDQSLALTADTSMLPKHWQKLGNGKYCKVEEGVNGLGQVTMSLVIEPDRSVSAFVAGKKVPSSSNVLTCLHCSNEHEVLGAIKAIDNAVLCPGNPEEKFVSVCRKRGGSVRGQRGSGDVIAVVEDVVVEGPDGEQYSSTVRKVDCSVLCPKLKKYPVRCKACQLFRSTLRAMVTRQAGQADHTSTSSHTRYKDLHPSEKDERLKNLRSALTVSHQKVKRLEAKVYKLIAEEAMRFQDEDVADVSQVMADVNPVVEINFPVNSPQRMFWEQQRRYSILKDKRQMRWHPLVVRFALNLKYLSGTAYQAIHQCGIIHLPSERTLFDYTHWAKVHTGVQLEFVEKFWSLLEQDVPCGHHHCAISMDEMKLKSGLVFSKHTGILVGFVDLGSSNRDMQLVVSQYDQSASASKPDKPSTPLLAEQVLVFMARAIFKPSLTMPIAHFYSINLKGIRNYCNL